MFKYDGPYDAYLDVNMIGELKQWNLNGSDEVMMGGNVSLTKALQLFPEGAQLPGYEYMNGLKKHWSRVANVPVRNVMKMNFIHGYSSLKTCFVHSFRMGQLLGI